MADTEPSGRGHAHQRPHGETEAVMVAVIKRKIRVILADDHPAVRDGLAAVVNQQADMEVVAEGGDGEEAIALYEQHRPDVMVLDLRMPKRDGVAVVQRVLEINPKACLLIMTTYDGDEDIFQCLSQGAKGHLLKDAPRQEILSAIRAVSEDRPYTSSSVAAKAR
ncbi:MAG: response regulator transcription factor, partial [Gammaproteobacteria bacterium]